MAGGAGRRVASGRHRTVDLEGVATGAAAEVVARHGSRVGPLSAAVGASVEAGAVPVPARLQPITAERRPVGAPRDHVRRPCGDLLRAPRTAVALARVLSRDRLDDPLAVGSLHVAAHPADPQLARLLAVPLTAASAGPAGAPPRSAP